MGRQPALATPALRPLAWRVASWYLPAVALALAAVLLLRDVMGGDEPQSLPATVDAGHSERLAANIAFFEGRVIETRDHLSYNRLTSLYLQRLRETGDTSDLARAERSARASLEAANGDYSGLVLLAMVRVAQHDFAAAEELSRQAITVRPALPDAYAVHGDALMALGRYEDAGEEYAIVLERAPGPAAFARQAVLAEVRGNVPVAEQFWLAAIDADFADAPEASAWARVQLANLRFTLGELDHAREQYETALQVFPGYVYAEAGLGRVAAARGDWDEAAAHYERANGRIPLPEHVAALADVYARAGRAQEATAQVALMRAIGQLAEANGVRNDLTLIQFELDHGGDLALALERARLIYEERPSLEAADLYGWALYRAGQLDEARAKAEEALRYGTRDSRYLFHAGAIAVAQGDFAAGRVWLEQVQDLNPAFSPLHAPAAATLLEQAKERTK